ncbi:retrovirus-related pol polyprotein from transposon TNT 1-94 [Tanacetum coccineum]
MYKLDPVILAPKVKNNRKAHEYYLKHTIEQAAILKDVVKQAKSRNPLDSESYSAYNYMYDARHELCFLEFVSDMNASSKSKSRPTRRTLSLVGNACPLTRITTTNKVPLREPIPLKVVAQESIVTKVYTRRPKVSKTNGSNSKPKIAKSVIFNIMEPGTSRGSNTSVAPSSSSVDLRDMMASSPICLLSKATKTKSWLWHHRLSHLNFGAINHLARHGLVRGLPRIKFEKEHLCSTCAMGKMFDVFFSPPASVAFPVPVEEAPSPVESTCSPSSTTVDQRHPTKTIYEESSSSDVIPTTVHLDAPISEHLIEPNTYKDALTQSCWIKAMQEELHEFERLEVRELVPPLDKVMEEGIDFEESFALVARLEVVRIFLAFAAHMNMIVY